MSQRFTKSEIARAVQACQDARLEIDEVVISPDGAIRLVAAKAQTKPTINPADLIEP